MKTSAHAEGTGSATGSAAPPPRKCETERCDRERVVPQLVARVVDQTDGARAGWVWDCDCGWKRIEAAR